MAGVVEYLPGTRAMLVYTDEHGNGRSSIVQVINKKILFGQTWYAVKARQTVLRAIGFVILLTNPSNIFVEDGWMIGLVNSDSIEPLGTRHFTIVQ